MQGKSSKHEEITMDKIIQHFYDRLQVAEFIAEVEHLYREAFKWSTRLRKIEAYNFITNFYHSCERMKKRLKEMSHAPAQEQTCNYENRRGI